MKVISLTVVLAMVLSISACSRRTTGSGRIHSDERSKREGTFTIETEIVPTTTEPTETDPTDPTDPSIIISPTPATPNNTVKYDPTELTLQELLEISDLCIGFKSDEAIMLLTAILGIDQYTESDSGTSSNSPADHYLRYMSRDILVDGVLFKSIGIHENDSGIVYSLDYSMRETALFDANEALDSEKAYNTLYPVFCEICGDPDEDYDSNWVTFNKSGQAGWNYSDDCDVYAFWGQGAQNVTGNDQFVIGFQCADPENHMSDFDGDSYLIDTYGLMFGVIGMNLDDAKARVENYFNISLGDGEVMDGEGSTLSYIFNADISIEGCHFTQVELEVNKNQVVYDISFLNTEDEESALHEECLKLKDLVTNTLGDPDKDHPLSDSNKDLEYYEYDLEGDAVVSVGCYYSGMGINSLWFGLEDGSLK